MDWHKEYPSVVTRVKFSGDEGACPSRMGDAMKLLYQVKKEMAIGGVVNILNRTRMFTDGTIINIQSCFGLDVVSIFVPPAVGEELLPLPDVAPVVAGIVGTKVYFRVGGAGTVAKFGHHFFIDLVDLLTLLGHNTTFYGKHLRIVENRPYMGVIFYYLNETFASNANTVGYIIKFKVGQRTSGSDIYGGVTYQKHNFTYETSSFGMSEANLISSLPVSGKSISLSHHPDISTFGNFSRDVGASNSGDCAGGEDGKLHHVTSGAWTDGTDVDNNYGFSWTHSFNYHAYEKFGPLIDTIACDFNETMAYDVILNKSGSFNVESGGSKRLRLVGMNASSIDDDLSNLKYNIFMNLGIRMSFRVERIDTVEYSVHTWACPHGHTLTLNADAEAKAMFPGLEWPGDGTPYAINHNVLLNVNDGSLSCYDHRGILANTWHYSIHPGNVHDPFWPIAIDGMSRSSVRSYTEQPEPAYYSWLHYYVYPFERPGAFREVYPVYDSLGNIAEHFFEYEYMLFGDYTDNEAGIWLDWETFTKKFELSKLSGSIITMDDYDYYFPEIPDDQPANRGALGAWTEGATVLGDHMGGGESFRYSGYFSNHSNDIYVVGGVLYYPTDDLPTSLPYYFGRSSRELAAAKNVIKLKYFPVIQSTNKLRFRYYDDLDFISPTAGSNDGGVIKSTFFPE